EAGERLRLLDERDEDALALTVGGLRERVGLRDLEDEETIGAWLAHLPDRADAALTEPLDELVALDDRRLLLLRDRRRGRRAAHRPARRGLDERRGDRAERGEPHVEHRELARADRPGDERGHPRRVL